MIEVNEELEGRFAIDVQIDKDDGCNTTIGIYGNADDIVHNAIEAVVEAFKEMNAAVGNHKPSEYLMMALIDQCKRGVGK